MRCSLRFIVKQMMLFMYTIKREQEKRMLLYEKLYPYYVHKLT